MIDSILLRNFQIHEYTHLDLEKITVVVGDNDKGKSSVLRALQWCFFNLWEGKADEFINWNAESATVEVWKDNRHLGREKGKGVNRTWLDNQNFPDIGISIPKEIGAVLNLCEDNFQDQDAAAYWLSLRPAEASAALNELFNLEAIDTSAANIASELRQTKAAISEAESRLKEARAIMAELGWVEAAATTLKNMEDLQGKIVQYERYNRQYTDKLRQLSQLEKIEQSAGKVISLGEKVLALRDELSTVERQHKQLTTYLNLEKDLCRLAGNLLDKEEELNNLLLEECPLCGRSGSLP
jgi:DNA repair exonuclease SbcCD ATPase subunit